MVQFPHPVLLGGWSGCLEKDPELVVSPRQDPPHDDPAELAPIVGVRC